MWCLVEVITYYTEDSVEYTEIETFDFVGVNGFTNPNLGARFRNPNSGRDFDPCPNPNSLTLTLNLTL